MRFTNMQLENERLKHFLPESYTEMRQKVKSMQDTIASYEQKIYRQENEKRELHAKLQAKDDDIRFMKSKLDESNSLWRKEVDEKKKLEAIVEQQYREAMDLDTAKRKAEEDRMIYQQKNRLLRAEVEELVKENKKLTGSIDGLNERLHSLRKVNKQQEKKLENSQLNLTMQTTPGNNTTIKQPK